MRLHFPQSKMIKHKGAVTLCLVLSLTFVFCGSDAKDREEVRTAEKKPEVRLPNILLIVLDTVSAEGASLGSGSNMPNLSAAAESGYTFTNCRSTSDHTRPSHISIFSGRTISAEGDEIAEEADNPEHSLMNLLSQCGYRTYGIAANGVVSLVESTKAFDVYKDKWVETGRRLSKWTDPSLRIDMEKEFLSVFKRYGLNADPKANNFQLYRYHVLIDAENINEEVKGMITKHVRFYPERPFFLFVNYFDPHDPYLPGPEFYELSEVDKIVSSDLRNRPLPEDFEERILKDPRIKYKKILKWQYAADLSDEQLAVYRQRYLAEIRELDHHLGSLFDWLKSEGLYSDAMIIITSDHGESFGEEDTITHWLPGMNHLKSTHSVPLVILPERKLENGGVIEYPILISDIAPTIYDVLGIEHLYPYDGKSLLAHFSSTSFREYEVQNKPQILSPTTLSAEQDEARKQKRIETLRSLGYLE